MNDVPQLALRIVLMATLVVAASGATAHALLLRAQPEAETVVGIRPQKVVAWFSQELETSLSSMRVYDNDGRQVDLGDGRTDLDDPNHATLVVSLQGELGPGPYVVRWTVVSAEDGDPTEGEFRFGIGTLHPPQQDDAAARSSAGYTTPTLVAVGILGIFAGLWLVRARRHG